MIASKHGTREAKGFGSIRRPICACLPLDRRTTRIRQTEQLRNLVESLTRRIVTRTAEESIVSPGLHVEQQRVTTGDEQRGKRRHRLALLERSREQVPFHVMHTDDRNIECVCQCFREADANEQRADESWTIGDGNRFEVLARDARVGKRALDNRNERGDVSA